MIRIFNTLQFLVIIFLRNKYCFISTLLLVPIFILNANAGDANGKRFTLDKNCFIENKGQWDEKAIFLAKLNGKDVWITREGLVYDYYELQKRRKGDETEMLRRNHVVKASNSNCNPQNKANGHINKNGYLNFLIGENQDKWSREVKMYEEVLVNSVYENINQRYYIEDGSIRYDYIVKPNGRVSDIQVRVDGVENIRINENGELTYQTLFGEVSHTKLYTFQEIKGRKQEVKSRFKIIDKNTFGFEVSEYDSNKNLVIDPVIYSTIMGGTLQDYGYGVVADNAGNTFLTGNTASSNFPVTIGVVQPVYLPIAGSEMGFVAKLNNNGTNLIYCTYVGGNYTTRLYKIDIHQNTGIAYAIGNTFGPGLPIVGNNSVYSSVQAILVVLNANGTNYVYSRYIGGTNVEIGIDLRVDQANPNLVYITGSTSSNTFQTTIPYAPFTGTRPFVGMVNTSIFNVTTPPYGYSYMRILEAQTGSSAKGIDIDASGNAYVTGQTFDNTATASTTFPGTIFAGTLTNNSFNRCFVTKLNSTGAIVYSTFGGSDISDAFVDDIAIHANNEAYVVGTADFNFPVSLLGFPYAGGTSDALLLRVNAAGSNVDSRFLGGNAAELGRAIQVFNNNVYITGATNSTNYPAIPCPVLLNAGNDVLYSRLSLDLTNLLYSTKLSGNLADQAYDMDVDASGIYFCGATSSTNYPVPSGSLLIGPGGSTNMFLTKYEEDQAFTITATSNAPVCIGGILTLSVTGPVGVSYTWTGPNFTATTTNTSVNVNPFQANNVGIYTVVATDVSGCTASATVNVTTYSPFVATIWNLSGSNCDPKELYATPTGAGYTYQWTNAPGGPVLSITSSCAVPFGTTATYTVIVTDANGCTASSIFIAYALPIVTATATPSQMQCSGVANLLASPITYPSYSWSPSVGLNSSSIYNPTATVTATTVYTVTVTDVNGCTGESFTTVTLGNQDFCCSPQASMIANDPTTILLDNEDMNNAQLQAALIGNSLQGQTLFINGTFTVNQPLELDGCNVYFAPNSKIEVLCGMTLDIINASILSAAPAPNAPGGRCDMWDGIYSSCNTATININTGSRLSDMITGVAVSNNAKLFSSNAIYTDNRNSIQLLACNDANSYSITNNTFNTALLLSSPFLGDKPRYGISIYNCNNLHIGTLNNPNTGNVMNGLWCGIFLQNTLGGANPTIYLNHNRFENILGTAATWGSQITTSTRGWCIYGFNLPSTTNFNVHVYGYLNASTDHFQDCDKGILLRRTGGSVMGMLAQNTVLGVLMTECQGRFYKIQNNIFENTELGICKNGDESANGFYCYNNTITLSHQVNPALLNIAQPTGIVSQYSSNNNIGTSNIIDNKIHIPLENSSYGIRLTNGSKDVISGNAIHMTAPNGVVPNPPAVPNLVGIYSNNSLVPLIHNNTIDNNNSVNGNTTYVPGNNAGIYLTANTESKLSCNKTNFLKYGILAAGLNGSQTDYTRTIGNYMRCQDADMLFWQLGSDGTLGVIGKVINQTSAYNANNTFLAGTGLNKVYRLHTAICNTPWLEGITTTNPQLSAAQSGSTSNTCNYPVINPLGGFTSGHYCNSNNMMVSGSFGDDDFDADLAAQIAQGQIEYEEEFDEGASRIHEEMLLAWLIENDTVRNTHPLLDSFYLAHYSTTAGQLVNVDLLLSKLSDSLLMITPAAWQATLSDAKMNNNAINPQALFDAHAKAINALYIKSIEYGIDTLSVEERETIEQLANACPLIAGNGVYRARALHSMLEPGIHYDDIVICNSQGVYKNGSSKLQLQLDKLTKDKSKNMPEMNFIRVYPVPAIDKLNINYSLNNGEQAEFVLYDVLGSKLQTIVLKDDNEIETIDLSAYGSGIYTYQYIREGHAHQAGKIVISK